MRSLRAAALLLAAGCGARQVELHIPFGANARSAIVAVLVPEGGAEVIHHIEAVRLDVGGGFPILLPRDPALPARVVVLSYEVPLEALSIPAGELVRAESGRPLPPAASVVQSVLSDGVASPFTTTSSLGPALRAFALPALPEDPEAGCPIFRATSIPIRGAVDNLNWVLPADGGGVLVGGEEGIWRVEADLRTSSVAFPAKEGQLSAALDGMGNAWLGSRAGPIWRAKIGRTLTDPVMVTSVPSSPDVDWIDVGPAPEGGVEIFTLHDVGPLHRFQNGVWSDLHMFPMLGTLRPVGAVLRRGPGKVRAVLSSSNEVVSIEGARKSVETTESADGFSELADLPSWGLIASSIALYQRQGEAWVKLPLSEHRILVEAMIELEGGILLGGARGFVAFYRRDKGLCPSATLASGKIVAAARLGDGILLVGDAPDDASGLILSHLRVVGTK